MPDNKIVTLVLLILMLFSGGQVLADMMDHVDMDTPDMKEAEMTREELVQLLKNASPEKPLDLSSKRLSGLDLSDVDFRGANLRSVRMNKTDLRGANLSGVNLDTAWMLGANLEGANLSGASLFSTQMMRANLKGANLSKARIVANLSHADLTGANLSGTDMSADMKNQSMGLMRLVLRSATLDKANLTGSKAGRADLEFASLRGANLENADFSGVEMAEADLTGANVRGLILDGADVTSSILVSLKNASEIIGLDTAKNRDQAILK